MSSSSSTSPELAPVSFTDEDAEVPTSPVIILDPTLRDRAVIVEAAGVHAGRPHALGDAVTLGRSAECGICFDDDALSRQHARIGRDGSVWFIEDLGSLNGTHLGDQRVRRAVLHDGDRIRLGAGVVVRFQLVTDDEQRALARIYEAGRRDALTGLANRKQLEDQLRAELSFARRHGTPLSVVMVDVDRFKAVNDGHGHLVGDAVLRHVARVIGSGVRIEDLVARFGGEEFVIVARATPLEGAAQLAERLRDALEQAPARTRALSLRVTASFGVASLDQLETPTMEALLGRADERLYAAKARGRNRVVAA